MIAAPSNDTGMAEASPILAVSGLSKTYSRHIKAVRDVSLTLRRGEFFALLGPSGCGKTTLLRMIAGMETPDSGAIHLDGIEITAMPPWSRPVNMVFQSYAIFPHLTVFDNVAYGLKLQKIRGAELRHRVESGLDLVRMTGMGGRFPDTISGGQRQRVALARALVMMPRILLLDEPLSALDAQLRENMQYELVRLNRKIGITFIIVTHDQKEALSMADRIAVMREGAIEQIAPPQQLYESPANSFVADFIGAANLFPCRYQGRDEAGLLELVSDRLAQPIKARGVGNFVAGQELYIAVRPENLRLDDASASDDSCQRAVSPSLIGVLSGCSYGGDTSLYRIVHPISDTPLRLRMGAQQAMPIDAEEIGFYWNIEDGVVLPF